MSVPGQFDPNDPFAQYYAQQQMAQGGQQPPPLPPQPGQQQPPQYQVDPNLQSAVLGMRGNPAAQAKVTRQQKMADMLRADATKLNSGGQMVGGRYIGPNAFTALAQGLGGYKAGQMDQEADIGQNAIIARDRQANEQLMDALRKQRGQGRDAPYVYGME